MDGTRFDDLSRRLVGRLSRRTAFAALLPGILAGSAPETAGAARCLRIGARCNPRDRKECCSGRCPKGTKRCTCRRDQDCGKGRICAGKQCVVGAGTCRLADSACRTGVDVTCNGTAGCVCAQDRAGRPRCGAPPSGGVTLCDSDADCAGMGPGAFCLPDGPGSNCDAFCILPCGV